VSTLASTISDFFNSGTWLVIRNLLVFFAVLFWASLGYWVYKDARRRIADPLLVSVATLVGLVPPYLGPFVYMLFRPPEYLDDVRERELEIRAIEERLVAELRCPVCRSEVEASFLVCPVCTTRLKQACPTCKAPLEPIWQICPHCATPIAQTVTSLPATAPRARRRRE
jgi:Double zinc ribbon